jgi:hypothetical protein
MRKTFLSLFLAITLSSPLYAQFTLSFGFLQNSLTASSGGASTAGTAFALMGNPASVVTWTYSFSVNPSSVTMLLQGSVDNTSWYTLDSSTVVDGAQRSVTTSTKFIRCYISAKPDGGTTTCSLIAKAQPTSNASLFNGGTITGNIILSNNSNLQINQGTLTADKQAITSTATWNNAAVTFTHWKENITDTASNSSSLLLDLQVGGTSKLSVTKAGALTATSTYGTSGVYTGVDSFLEINGRARITSSAIGIIALTNGVGTDFSRLQFGGITSSFPSIKRSGSRLEFRLGDDSDYANIRAAGIDSSAASITGTAAIGTSVLYLGTIRTQVYKVTVAKEAFIANDVTQDITLGTLPAKTFLTAVIADVSVPLVCGSVCTTATLSAVVGKTAGTNEYLVSFDLDAAAAVFGDADAEYGASLARATVQTRIGDLGSWAATQAVILRATSGTGNWGNGSATNLSAGSITFYLVTTRFP